MAFHCAIVSVSKNRWLGQAHALLIGGYACLHYRYIIRQKEYLDAHKIYNDHPIVLDVLGKNDIEGVKIIVRLHMQRVKDKVEKELFSHTSRTNKMDDEYSGVKIPALT
jgi:DNA-binding FadR family transcriptional regulator